MDAIGTQVMLMVEMLDDDTYDRVCDRMREFGTLLGKDTLTRVTLLDGFGRENLSE